MILITGATGHFGGLVIDSLLEKGVEANQISALVRNVEKAEALKNKGINLKIGDYDNYTLLVDAFKGTDKLMFVSATDIDSRLAQHKNVVNAAKGAGVKHIVYTSFQRKNDSGNSPLGLLAQSHVQTEKWLKESGLSYTILKNNLYMDFIPFFIGEKVLETGIYLPAGKGKISAALRSEYAEATANILTSAGHENKIYDFTNVEAYSYDDVAKIISQITGKTIKYVSPSIVEFTQTLSNAGVPEEGIGVLSGFSLAQKDGELDLTSPDLENLLGRKPTNLETFLKTVYTKK
ncbi:SDR family oxidoreductase [Yeosuana marina]|uniref:SDR family oxidoreductase n=1 Tax=Yeosuana marina TaxID=1565536 RepID=UPI0030EEA45E|tara:strand:- start:572 stop:1444 length:873 start_codon:yes stop_codon:yes gene_type:complete